LKTTKAIGKVMHPVSLLQQLILMLLLVSSTSIPTLAVAAADNGPLRGGECGTRAAYKQ
jgi:hypothetical protein